MTAPEIKTLCQNGSAQYLKYLTENKKGRSIISIVSITALPKAAGIFKLELAGKIFEPDAVKFQYVLTGREYDTSVFKIREYDYDRNLLFIKQEGVVEFDLRTIRVTELIIVTDMKFLVERVQDYFTAKGDKLRLPKTPSKPNITVNDFNFLPNTKPDDSQAKALLSIFQNPLTYIWGAPGTGKTKLVLSYSILYYIKWEKRVAIFAPTNVALEQVLRGVISILDASGISRDKLLRIGTPSRVFATEFPDVCEVRGVEKKLDEINKQIAIIESILGLDDTSQDFQTYDQLTKLMTKVEPIVVRKSQLDAQLRVKDKAIREGSKELILQGKQIQLIKASLHAQELKLTGIWHRIVKYFTSGKTHLEKRIDSLHACYVEEERKNLDLFELHTTQLEEKEKLVSTIGQKEGEIESVLQTIKTLPFKLSALAEIAMNINLTNLRDQANRMPSILNKQQEDEDITSELKKDYAQYEAGSLEKKLQEFYFQRSRLDKLDTTERLKSVNVIAATFDGFISRFTESSIDIDHVFVDEAGYANIVKALSVFVFDKPVTLLGDHMQLPPVNELNDQTVDASMDDTIVWRQSAIYCCNVFDSGKAELIANYDNNIQSLSQAVKYESLKKTHRFGSSLANVINTFVYKNGFHSGSTTGETTIRFIRAPKVAPRRKRDNLSEVSAINRFITQQTAYIDYSRNDSIAVLSPYADQIEVLGREFPRLRQEMRILTVHKSQGREWDTVILSVCDTDWMWFTDSTNLKSKGLNLLNTAVSRAKHELIIVCDYEFWIKQKGQFLQGLLQEATEILV